MSDNQPDFDNMTPEEIMAWMETLAKRQGASEGFTTAADMQIAEIDPDSVVIDEPGYVPYGQERAQPAAPPPAPARPAAPPPAAAQPPPSPVRSTQPAPVVPPPVRSTQQTPAVPPPAPPPHPSAASVPTMLTNPAAQRPVEQRPPEPEKADPPVDEGALAWLESLAADQGDGLFNLDLSGFSDEVDDIPVAPTQPVNPMNWLEDLARAQSPGAQSLEQFEEIEDEYNEEESEKLDPYGEGVNPMEWLETLAVRQGANREELTTPARMNIPAPEDTEVEDDDYQPFSFDTLPTRRSTDPTPVLENPADWLNAIADAQGYSEDGVRATQPDSADMSMSGIQDAITRGTVTSEQMQYFLDRQADELANLPPEDYDDEEDVETALHPAELPDWLSDLKPKASAPEPSKSIDALFEAPVASDMPDWLKQDVLGSDIHADLERIFEPEDEPSRPLEPEERGLPADIVVDVNDPWVEALDEEYEQGGMANIDEVPEWYAQNLQDEQRLAVIEGRVDDEGFEDTSLVEAALPEESNLSAGQPQAIPAWLGGTEPVMADEEPEPVLPVSVPVAEAEPAVFEEMPDWLKEVESAVSPQDVPEWLIESINVEDESLENATVASATDIFAEPAPEPEPTPPPAPVVTAPVAPPPPQQTPVAPPPQPVAPPPARVSTGAAPALEGARDREQSGDLEGALADYEGLIRASVDLDAVVADLTQLVKSYKTVPAVYRVLGDGLMRQGKLQAALNTYREALNQL